MKDDIICVSSSNINKQSTSRKNLEIIRISNTAHGHVQLSMGKKVFLQIDSNFVQSLALRFVRCHGKGETDWKLPTLHVTLLWRQNDSSSSTGAIVAVNRVQKALVLVCPDLLLVQRDKLESLALDLSKLVAGVLLEESA